MGKKTVSKQKSVSSPSFPDLLNYCDVTKVHPALRVYLGYCMHKVTLIYKAAMYPYFSQYKMIPPHFSVLSVINSSETINQIMICAELGIDKASMVKIIDGLEKNKYIERVPSKQDRRVKNLCVTPLGKKIIEKINKDRMQHEADFLSCLTEQEAQQFKNTLLKLLDHNTQSPSPSKK